jgi:hypothetical protein
MRSPLRGFDGTRSDLPRRELRIQEQGDDLPMRGVYQAYQHSPQIYRNEPNACPNPNTTNQKKSYFRFYLSLKLPRYQ